MTITNDNKTGKFTIWHLFPIVFGIISLVTIWLFISSLISFYNFRFKAPLGTSGIVSSVDTSDAIWVSVKIINRKGETVFVKNKIGNETEGMKVGDKIDVLYFDESMNDAVLNTYVNIEGALIHSFVLMFGFTFCSIFLIIVFYSKKAPSWVKYILNLNQEE